MKIIAFRLKPKDMREVHLYHVRGRVAGLIIAVVGRRSSLQQATPHTLVPAMTMVRIDNKFARCK